MSNTPSSILSSRLPVETLDHARDIGLSLLRTFADRPSYVLGTTSALPNEGKTTISTGLAEVMATDFGLEVVLVDAHPERSWSRADSIFGSRPGISDWLSNEGTLDDALVPVHDKCSVLPFGTQTLTSRDLLQYMVNHEALQQLRQRFSLIILDLPDMMNPAAAALANLSDGLVLVVRSGETPVDRVREFLPLLQNVTIHGVVLNRHRAAVPAALRQAFT
jgi:Mrp family chromosome partitioning ATPase